jgi:hypothetical protein
VVEEWRDVPGHEGAYQVSNVGSVRSLVFRNKQIERARVAELEREVARVKEQ